MNIQEFYDRYKLNAYYFSELAGVGTKSLKKYGEGQPIRTKTREKIEKAMTVIIENDLVYPKFDREKAFDQYSRTSHCLDVWAYKIKVWELLGIERV